MNLHVQQARSELAKMTAAGVSMREISQKADCAYNTVRTLNKYGNSSGMMALSILNAIGVIKAERPEIAEKIAKMETDALAQIVCTADDQPSDFVLENRPAFETLDATVEQLAAQCVNADLTHVRDDALECGKQRRIAALEAEVSVVREQRNKLGFACEELTADLETEKRNFAALEQVHEQREQHLKSCENALIEADQKLNDANTAWVSLNTQHGTTTQQLSDANAEIKRLTALSETHGQSWKAACVQVEQLQKQLDHGQAAHSKLYNQLGATRAKYETQLEAANQKEVQLQEQLAGVYAEKTLHVQQVMRLRVYVWILIAALVFVLVGGLVVWGGV